MGLIQAIVLGIVQGLTEFLPISSSGHLYLVPSLMGWRDAGAGFTAVIQLGTILAVLIYFRHDLGRILSGLWRGIVDKTQRGTAEFRTGLAVAVGTVPAGLAGLLLEKAIDKDFRSAYVIAGTLIVLGVVLWIADRSGKKQRGMDDITVKDGLIVGLWQCLALVPGSSRSGSTMTGAMFLGLDREAAARFSFLLSVPVILLSGLYKLVKDRHELMVEGATNTLVATVVSFVVGFAAIAFLMRYLQRRSTGVFVGYRILLGILVLVLVASGRIPDHQKQVTSSEVHTSSQRG